MGKIDREYVYIISIDNNSKPNGIYLLSIGSTNISEIDYRFLVKYLLLINEKRFYIIHNHPNKILLPSEDDIIFVGQIELICKLLNFECIGNYILTQDGYCDIKTKNVNVLNYDDYIDENIDED